MARRRRSLLTRLKVPIQHAGTFIGNQGGATAPHSMTIVETETGARTTTGTAQSTKSFASTDETCNIGDTIKYVNLFLQAASREVETGDDRNGWLEWALVCVKESETAVPITQLGTLTLGQVCTNMFRNECIFTGAMPIGLTQGNYLPIKIKIPRSKQKLRIGDQWRFITYFRDVKATSTSTSAIRVIKSYMYKSYS